MEPENRISGLNFTIKVCYSKSVIGICTSKQEFGVSGIRRSEEQAGFMVQLALFCCIQKAGSDIRNGMQAMQVWLLKEFFMSIERKETALWYK